MRKFDITFENGDVVAESIPFALHSGNIVSALKEQSGADRVARSFEAPDGTQVYVLDYEFIRRIHIIPPTTVPEFFERTEKEFEYDEIGVADYVSGAVISPLIDEVELPLPGDDPDEDPPTRQVIRNLRITDKTVERFPADIARHKVAIQEHGMFAPLRNANDTNTYSQHASMKPGLYTGAMRPLVQVLLGLGRVKSETYEQRWVRQNDKALLSREDLGTGGDTMLSPFGLFHEQNLEEGSKFSAQVMYDYRWNRTHGISWGADGKAYVVEIGQRGVLVMPLAVDPISTTEAGRARYEALFPELTDPAWMEVYGGSFLDRFGGFPTGSPPPLGTEQMDKWVRAGELVKALDSGALSEVYSKMPYSTAMGWAFHPSGREAHNTCYSYAPNGVKEGYHYAITVSIGAVEEREVEPSAEEVIAYLRLSGMDTRKARRMTDAQAQSILWITQPEAAKEAFDALTVTPDVQVTAHIRMQKKGFLYTPALFAPPTGNGWTAHPQIKFPEPLIGNPLLSADFTAEDVDADKAPRCDTPVFVFFRGGELVVVNYAWQYEKPGSREEINTRQPCQYDGSWTSGHWAEGATTHGNFYTSDVDWRESIHGGGGSMTTTTGTQVAKLPFLSFCAFFAKHSISSYEYWYTFESSGRSSGSKSRRLSVAIPAGERSVYLIGKFDEERGIVTTQSYAAPSIQGHGSGRAPGIVYNFVMHWSGACNPGYNDGDEVTCVLREHGSPYQVESCWTDSITVGETPYAPCEGGASALSVRYGAVPTGESWDYASEPSNEVGCEIRLYGDTFISGEVTRLEKRSGKDPGGAGGLVDFYSLNMSTWWWKPSPDLNGAYAYMKVNINRFGTDLIGYEPDFDANAEFKGGPEEMRTYLGACYIGWVA